MKPFRFTLQALLTLRQHHEQRAMEQYAHTLESRRLALVQRDAASHTLDNVRAELRLQLSGGTPAVLLSQAHAYSRLVELRLHQASQKLAATEQAATEALQSLVAARKDRETLETLRDRRLKLHATQARRLDDRLLDELATRRHGSPLNASPLCACP
jgi:flagellar export protein FliJ